MPSFFLSFLPSFAKHSITYVRGAPLGRGAKQCDALKGSRCDRPSPYPHSRHMGQSGLKTRSKGVGLDPSTPHAPWRAGGRAGGSRLAHIYAYLLSICQANPLCPAGAQCPPSPSKAQAGSPAQGHGAASNKGLRRQSRRDGAVAKVPRPLRPGPCA